MTGAEAPLISAGLKKFLIGAAVGGGAAAAAGAFSSGGKPKLPSLTPATKPPTEQSPEVKVAKEEIKLREKQRRGRAASLSAPEGFLQSANIFTPSLSDTTG